MHSLKRGQWEMDRLKIELHTAFMGLDIHLATDKGTLRRRVLMVQNAV